VAGLQILQRLATKRIGLRILELLDVSSGGSLGGSDLNCQLVELGRQRKWRPCDLLSECRDATEAKRSALANSMQR
jgi:hypothetical protein